jgi:16S rRNA (adenine1518-N6/adenine1519-N6)-dimethyltransferase
MDVRPKKKLGQHFLKDRNIARQIVGSLEGEGDGTVIEIGPGTGVLTGYLLERFGERLHAVEIDPESVEYLEHNFPGLSERIYREDFLRLDLHARFTGNICIIGNFPYNISSQILFRILDFRSQVREVVGMFQREVARRISSGPGTKEYGILSVLMGAYFDITYLFTVSEKVFTPPPKVKSGVLRIVRNNRTELPCSEQLFFKVVKMSFNQRRKTLRNSLSALILPSNRGSSLLDQRPEQLSVDEFIRLTEFIEGQIS